MRLLLGLFFLFSASICYAEERITSFTSDITINADASLNITETINVIAEGGKIKHGIYRDFPTIYHDRFGNAVKVWFEINRIMRDGQEINYQVKSIIGGKRIYFGDPKVSISPGRYSFTFTYTTSRQLKFLENYDELYWNVTGNDWDFAIENARATITLPQGAKVLQQSAYTGPKGARGQAYTVDISEPGKISFTTTRRLNPKEGLTVAVAWPKGIIPTPTDSDNLHFLLEDNIGALIALGFFTLIFIYYIFFWYQIGRDIPRGTIIPLFTPPENLSPAGVHYVMNMGIFGDHSQAFASALINMAVKGYLQINQVGSKVGKIFSVTRINRETELLSSEEKVLGEILFKNKEELNLTGNNRSIGEALRAFQNEIKEKFKDNYFSTNSKFLIPPIVISIISLIFIYFTAVDRDAAGFAIMWLLIWTIVVTFLCSVLFFGWRSRSLLKTPFLLFLTIFTIPFLGGEIFGAFILANATSWPTACIFIMTIVIHAIFYHLLKAPTWEGRQLMDKIEGFKMYLSTAEKERLNKLNPPEMTPQLFEKYLPYALALGVENEWSENFSRSIPQGSASYTPSWYKGNSFSSLGAAGFASSLGSGLSSAISSASSSSSGSGGGGSSGGGRGGGGGGGF